MVSQRRLFQSIPWAWAAAWALASTGMIISDGYSDPNRGWTAAYVLGFAGWLIGASVTIGYVHRQYGANGYITALRISGWSIEAFVAVVLGYSWLQTWNGGYWGPIVAAALGGAIGGALTLPVRSPSSLVTIAGKSLLSAFSWGVTFLVFQTLAFYAGYILVQLTVNQLVPVVGNIWAGVPGWAIPAALCGLHAAMLASRSLRSSERMPGLSPGD